MLIPERIKPYFLLTDQRQSGENTLVSGRLLCCEQHSFRIRTVGTMQHSLFHRLQLQPGPEGLAFGATCAKCGRTIPVFDARSDGYDNCFSPKGETSLSAAEPLRCPKCGGEFSSADLRFEYPGEQELADLGCRDPGNAFTWIWASLTCAGCGRRHTDFISCETA